MVRQAVNFGFSFTHFPSPPSFSFGGCFNLCAISSWHAGMRWSRFNRLYFVGRITVSTIATTEIRLALNKFGDQWIFARPRRIFFLICLSEQYCKLHNESFLIWAMNHAIWSSISRDENWFHHIAGPFLLLAFLGLWLVLPGVAAWMRHTSDRSLHDLSMYSHLLLPSSNPN